MAKGLYGSCFLSLAGYALPRTPVRPKLVLMKINN